MENKADTSSPNNIKFWSRVAMASWRRLYTTNLRHILALAGGYFVVVIQWCFMNWNNKTLQ